MSWYWIIRHYIPIEDRTALDLVQVDAFVDGVGVSDGAGAEDQSRTRVGDPAGIRAVRGGGEIQLR